MSFLACSQRILHDRVKVFFIIVLMVIPLMDIGQILLDFYQAEKTIQPDPRYLAFSALSTTGTNHILHKLMFWFLPIYLLIIVGEDCIEDWDTGCRDILIGRMGKKQYIWGRMRNSFTFCFLLILCSLMLNYGLLQMIFHQGTDIWIVEGLYPPEENRMYTIGYEHPVPVNLAVILMASVFSGLIGAIGSGFAMCLHDRKLVYAITFMLWFVFIIADGGLMSILHPFTNLTMDRFTCGFLLLASGYLAVAAVLLIAEVKSDEIS